MTARLGRVALEVADIDAAVADFGDLFEVAFRIVDFPGQGLRAAIGDHGIEFVQMTAPGWVPSGPGLLQGACIAVDDVERSCARLRDRGHEVVMEIPLESGRREYVFRPIHGIPIMIYQECGHFDLAIQ